MTIVNIIWNKIKDWIYILIPMCCIVLWAMVALIKDNFTLIPASDFPTYYYVTHLIFTQPEQMYFFKIQPYAYTPFFAIVFFPMGFFTFEQAHWVFFFVLLVLTELCIIIFNQILVLKQVKNKYYRFLYLIALSNGIIFVQMFDCLTGRIFIAFSMLLFLKREIKFRELNKDLTNTKFLFIQMFILIFGIGTSAQFIFFIILYLFHKVKIKEFFKKVQIKKYLLLILAFFIQNFMFIHIFFKAPEAILNFLIGYRRGARAFSLPPEMFTYSYLAESRNIFSTDSLSAIIELLSKYFDVSIMDSYVFPISLIIMIIITILIHFQNNFTIEKQIGFWALFSLFFYSLIFTRYFVLLLPLIAILLIGTKFQEDTNLIMFIRKNFLILLGLLCIMLLYFMPPIHYLIRVFPFLYYVPIELLILSYTFIYIVLTLDIFLLNRKNKSKISYNKAEIKNDFSNEGLNLDSNKEN